MKEELEQKLIEKYPSLFADKDKSPRETLICFGCECGDGWYNILDKLFEKLSKFPDLKLTQVKEKYGTLRIYVNDYNEEVSKYIEDANRKSGKTCEMCGKKGKRRNGGWITTLCNGCYKNTK